MPNGSLELGAPWIILIEDDCKVNKKGGKGPPQRRHCANWWWCPEIMHIMWKQHMIVLPILCHSERDRERLEISSGTRGGKKIIKRTSVNLIHPLFIYSSDLLNPLSWWYFLWFVFLVFFKAPTASNGPSLSTRGPNRSMQLDRVQGPFSSPSPFQGWWGCQDQRTASNSTSTFKAFYFGRKVKSDSDLPVLHWFF